MNLFVFFRCLFGGGHEFKNSRARPGYLTCQNCRYRKKWGGL